MKNPCDECLIDVICVKPCFKLREYLSHLINLDPEMAVTPYRLRRIYNLASSNPEYFRFYSVLFMIYHKIRVEKQNEISM